MGSLSPSYRLLLLLPRLHGYSRPKPISTLVKPSGLGHVTRQTETENGGQPKPPTRLSPRLQFRSCPAIFASTFTSSRMNIISKEIIKPSSPTPAHLKTHVLSLADSSIPDIRMPFVFLYKNYKHGDISNLKQSLSQCLTQYYPFAGRFSTPSMDRIECNDEGVEFLQASHDSRLQDFILKKENNESLLQLIPDVSKTSPVQVQLNHFVGGGAAVAVTMSHKVADGFSLITFINQWAKVARGESPFKPNFFASYTSSNNSNSNSNNVKAHEVHESKSTHDQVKYVLRNFVFPNSKLSELKKKVIMSSITGPSALTRVEVLTSLIFKCSVDAATAKSGIFKPSILVHPVNMRNKVIMKDSEKAVGNILSVVIERMSESREIVLNEVVAKLRKGKMEVEARDMKEIGENLANILPKLAGDGHSIAEVFWTTSLCWFPLSEVDFGWGKPIQAKYVVTNIDNKHLYLMDTPHRDGIEAIVRLPEEEMMIFQHDKELLAYTDDA